MALEEKVQENHSKSKYSDYIRGCFKSENAQLYGTFQQRAALNTTQFPKIQGSLLIRMGLVYPLMSSLVEYCGIPKETQSDFGFMVINYHSWLAGYLAYVVEIQMGLSKYPLELAGNIIKKLRN